jgi:hypothetical protein
MPTLKRGSAQRCLPRRWLILLALTLLPRLSSAQAVDTETLVSQGIELRKQGRDSEALSRFREAATREPTSPRILGHLSLALHATEQWIESERLMQEVLRAVDDPWVTRHITELQQSLESVQAHLAWLEVDAPSPGRLWIDGTPVGGVPTAQPIRVVAHPCELKLELPNRPIIVRTVEVRPGSRQYVVLTAPELPEPSPKSVNPLVQTQEPKAARVTVNSPLRRGLGFTLLGVASASLVAGVAFGIDALVLHNRAKDECTQSECTTRGVRLDARGRQTATFSTISFALGASSLGASAVLLW